MASSAAKDVIDRLESMSAHRSEFEWAWRQAVRVAAPDAGDFSSHLTKGGTSGAYSIMNTPTAARRSKDIYDSTAVWAVDRLASGLEALIVPQSEYWHNFEIMDLTMAEASYDERLWMEKLRNVMFRARYDADTGWITAVQTAFRRLVALGNAFIFVEDGIGNKSLVRYRYLPLNECYAAEDHYGQLDSFYRYYSMTARQARQKFGDKVSPALKRASESSNDAERPFMFVQAIHPRADFGHPSEGVKRAPWASLHIEHESRTVVGESGYYEFPIIDFRWMPEPGRVYGEGPVMKALADIQSLNLMAKNEMVASQQAIDPPLLTANAGVMNRINSNPGARNEGGLSPNGDPLAKPLFTGQRLDFATLVMEAKRTQVKESLYINLFQILVQNPQMSATEAMLRANEKGELLGPAGARIQQSLSRMTERELAIMERRGLYAQDSAFKPPDSLRGREVVPQFSGPLNRMRKAKEVEGTIQLLNVVSPIAQVDQTVVDRLDGDAMIAGLSDRLGVPVEFLRKDDAVAAIRGKREQDQNMAQQAAVAKDFAAAGKQGVDALNSLQAA